jgi:predicted DNA-binding protein
MPASGILVLHSVLQTGNLFAMETTLTFRLPKTQRDALKRRAAAEGRSESALVREIIEREINRGFDFERVRHLVGSLASPSKHRKKDPWRKQIREHNWRS